MSINNIGTIEEKEIDRVEEENPVKEEIITVEIKPTKTLDDGQIVELDIPTLYVNKIPEYYKPDLPVKPDLSVNPRQLVHTIARFMGMRTVRIDPKIVETERPIKKIVKPIEEPIGELTKP